MRTDNIPSGKQRLTAGPLPSFLRRSHGAKSVAPRVEGPAAGWPKDFLRTASILLFVLIYLLSWSIVTASADPTVHYVSTSGNDANPGSESEPFLTISRAAEV